MRLLWFGDLAATGFGTVTSDIGRALVELGVDARFVSQNEFPQLAEPFRSRTVDVAAFETAGQGAVTNMQDYVPHLIEGKSDAQLVSGEPWGEWKPDATVLLGDFTAARFFAQPYLRAFASLPSFHYVPIEGTDLPPRWNDLWRILSPVAMSRFGQEQIAQVIGQEPPLVYHGVDTDTFHPVGPSSPLTLQLKERRVTLTSKAACKAFFGGDPREPWVLRTDRHMPRKDYNRLLRAMAPVLAERPATKLVIHCSPFDQGGYLPDSISKLPAQVQPQVLLTQLGALPRDVLAALYNAADLYVSNSAEGFGLTIAEAVACGVPAVALDYSAVPEVVGPAGVVVPPAAMVDNPYDHFWAAVDEEKFGKAVGYLLDHPHKRIELGSRGPDHIRNTFRWDEAAERFRAIVATALPSKPVRVLEAVA